MTGRTAHPRSRGENDDEVAVRGARRGLIPAHAGKTCVVSRLPISIEAHPRSRGENCRGRPSQHAQPGSSPLTRGKL